MGTYSSTHFPEAPAAVKKKKRSSEMVPSLKQLKYLLEVKALKPVSNMTIKAIVMF